MRTALTIVLWSIPWAPLVAQQWARVRGPEYRPTWRHAPIVHDAERGRSILFGGTVDAAPGPSSVALAEQWEFDGYGWAEAQPRTRPPARYLHAVCYDSLRQRVLLFGGRSIPYVDRDDLWAFDGTDWTQLLPAQSPPARRSAALAYDSARDRVVLFGGVGAIYHHDTWEFDGSTWLPRPAIGPTARDGASIAFDPLRSVCVLSGGYNPGNSGLATTWEYDGNVWLLRAAQGMTGQFCFDPNVGRVTSPSAEWNGLGWTPTSGPGNLAPMPMLVFDQHRNTRIAFGGTNGLMLAAVQSGNDWLATGEPASGVTVLDSVRNRLLAFGRIDGRGTTNAWAWAGDSWSPVGTVNGWTLPNSYPRAFDPVRDRHYVMGVIGGGAGYLQTYRGSDLAFLSASVAPVGSGTSNVTITYDEARDRLVAVALIGTGSFPPLYLMKTFDYDGATWQQNVTSHSPPPRWGWSTVYDPVRQRCVLTGGYFLPSPDTWEFDGVDWVQISTPTPQLLPSPQLVFDPLRNRIVTLRNGEVWEYDGQTWTLATTLPSPRPDSLLGWDPIRQRLIGTGTQANCCAWESAVGAAASNQSFGTGCASSSASLNLQAESVPMLGRTLATRLLGLPPEHGLALQLVGFDDQTFGGVALPLPLAPLGGPAGCVLALAPAFADLQLHLGSTARFTVLLPTTPSLVGAVIFLQGAVHDPLLAVPLPFATSNGLRCTAGL